MSIDPHFPTARLAEVATFINGDRSTNYPGQDDYTDGGIPFVSASDLRDERIEMQSVKRITPAAFARLRSGKFEPDDVLFCLRGSIGKLAFVRRGETGAIASSLVIVRANANADPRFLFSFLRSASGQQSALSLNNGSAQPNVSVHQLQQVRLPLPSRKVQSEIAWILSAIDDRITLLRETNATLEAIAQALFKSWFVDFDPVRAKQQGLAPAGMDEVTATLFPDSFEASALGPVPRAWGTGRVEDLLELAYGKALKATDRVAGDVPVYGSGGVTGLHNCALVDTPTVIVGRKGTVGSLYWEDRPCFPIDTVFYVRARMPLTFCFYQLRVLGLGGMNTDGAVPGLNRSNVYRLAVVIPPAPVLAAFDDLATNLRSNIFLNETQAQTLVALRDALLPRLISGQLRLPEALAEMEEAA